MRCEGENQWQQLSLIEMHQGPDLPSPFNGQIAINSLYIFTAYAVWADLEFNLGIFLELKLVIKFLSQHPS